MEIRIKFLNAPEKKKDSIPSRLRNGCEMVRQAGKLTGSMEVFVAGQVRIPLVLGLLEVVQDVVVAPAGVPEALPLVEVPPVAPDVEHGVQDRAAPDHLRNHRKNNKEFLLI